MGDEDEGDRLDRNLDELLQEIRVTQTGVQVLTGFLLTVPFSSRFGDLDDLQRATYLAVLGGAVLTTVLVVAPAAFHRILFRHRERAWIVEAANQCARIGLVLMALTVGGVLFLVFDVVLGTGPAAVAGTVALVLFATVWVGVPVVADRRRGAQAPTPPADP